MSYDIYIELDGKYIEDTWVNHTYNGSQVCKQIIGMTPLDFNDLPAYIVYKLAKKVANEMSKNKHKYAYIMIDFDGWGTIDSWVLFMKDIMRNCKKYQKGIVKVS